jgi:nicotinamidase-related amidase
MRPSVSPYRCSESAGINENQDQVCPVSLISWETGGGEADDREDDPMGDETKGGNGAIDASTDTKDNTALLVIDVQVEVITGETPSYDHEGVLRRIGGLLERARSAGTPVIFVQHEEAGYPPMNVGAGGWQIHPAVAPLAEEPRVRKRACDSFYDTTLEAELNARGVGKLVVCGCDTDYCINTTVRSAVLTAPQIIAHLNASVPGINPDHESVVVPAAEVVF